MAVKQFHAKDLARLLNTYSQPIYVLDDEHTIVFLNQQCRNWLGTVADELLGMTCIYHTPAVINTAETVAAGLCPPPGLMTNSSGTVSYKDENAQPQQRCAWFYPIISPHGDILAVIAVVDSDDLLEENTSLEVESADELQGAELHEAIQRFRQEAAGLFRADSLVGNSPAMQLARRQVELATGNRSSVLLAGPLGSGRQHLAAVIHHAGCSDLTEVSPAGGLIPLDCSVLAADLILSTIAALTKSTPSGATSRQATLLLNHADEIPNELQNALAILFTKKQFPLRLISTARISLTELAARGQYREDLAAFLSTITIVLPPLSQRREDLSILAQMFLEEYNAKHAKQLAGFTPEAIDQLYSYAWPGNLNELIETVSWACQHASGHEIGVDDLPEQLHLSTKSAAYPRRPEEKIVLDEYLGRVERELIRRALTRSKGNKAKAARLLGLTRPRLYRRMVQLGLEEKPKDNS
jgi:DNA-binding NtrC family response regulator